MRRLIAAAFALGLLLCSGLAWASSVGSLTVGSQAASAPLRIGAATAPPGYGGVISIGIVCTPSVGSSLTYSVQVTADATPLATGNWNNHDVINNTTTSANGNLAYPVTGVRLNVTAYSSGSVTCGFATWP